MDYGKEFEKYATQHHGINSNYYNKIVSSMYPTGMTPNIIEERQMNIAIFDVFSRLMMDRIIFMGTGINDQVANIIQAQLLFLESVDSSKDIQIYINSPGGSVYAGLGIYDTMQFIKPDVATICTAREILILKEELYKIISKHSGQKYDKVYKDSDRDYWMKADKALEYGMIDEILTRDK